MAAHVDSEIEFRGTRDPEAASVAPVRGDSQAVAIAEWADETVGISAVPYRGQPPTVDASAVSRKMVCPCPFWKRAMDIIGASLVLVALSPILMAVAAIVNCGSPGPILFRQKRYGLGGQPFFVWKFRTIKTEEVPEQHQTYVINLMSSDRPFEKRDRGLTLIPCGRILRKLGLDEFPQLINVLKGEMSLVGPRPDVVPPENYQPWQMDRFDVLPGITGLWQVSGKNHTTFQTMIQLDLAYIRRRSVWLDLYILLQTIPAILWD